MTDPRRTLADRFGLALVPDHVAETHSDAVLVCMRLDQIRSGVAMIHGSALEKCSGCGAAVVVSPLAIKARRVCTRCVSKLPTDPDRPVMPSVTETAAAQAVLWFGRNKGPKQ